MNVCRPDRRHGRWFACDAKTCNAQNRVEFPSNLQADMMEPEGGFRVSLAPAQRVRGLMKAYLIYLRDRLRSSFWLVPSLMTSGAILAALFMLWLDAQPWSKGVLPWMTPSSAAEDGSRLVLSTIAGSMITVASLVFSMTLVALTLAAGNIGPRLIDRFMDNRINQVALGLFLATFVYSLLVLRAVTGGDQPFIPHLSVSLAMLMAIVSFGWLIVFIHDMARSIQVDNVVARVADELTTIFRYLPERYPKAVTRPNDEPMSGTPIRAGRSGYIQAIDPETLLELANDRDVIVQMRQRPGHFVIPSTVIAYVVGSADDDLAEEINAAVVLGPQRTATQDSAFSIDLIVEIAARALSPGINDFYTALACIDHLMAAFHTTLENGVPGNGFQDENGRLRLVLVPITIDGLFDNALHPLRRMGCSNVSVTLRLIKRLTMLAESQPPENAMAAIERHGGLIHQAAIAQSFSDVDHQAIDDGYARLEAALEDNR